MTAHHDTHGCCTPTEALEACTPDGCCSPAANTDTAPLLGEETPADVAAIRRASFTLLRETGEPISPADLTSATGIGAGRVAEIYEAVRARGSPPSRHGQAASAPLR